MSILKKYPLTLLCIVVIWILCLCRPPQVEIDIQLSFGIDKVAHFIMYAGTCGVIWWEYLHSHTALNWKKILLYSLFAPILMSGTIELVQGYATDYRGADWGDVLANAIGAFFGLFVGYCILRPFIWKSNK